MVLLPTLSKTAPLSCFYIDRHVSNSPNNIPIVLKDKVSPRAAKCIQLVLFMQHF